MIKLKKINKYYKVGKGRFHALKDVDLTINKGEFVSIEGQSGAGKSTLMHIIGCLDGFDSGEYYLDEKPISEKKDKEKANIRGQKVGFVMQDFALIAHESVLYNVMLPMYFSKMKRSKMKTNALDMLALVGISDQAGKRVNQLSGGQKQRVAIARALVGGCEVILADEPTGALDTKTSEEIMSVLKKVNKEKSTTVIVVTHDSTVSEYCGRKIVISDGIIISDQNQK